MLFQRFALIGLVSTLLPVVSACNQTAAPSQSPGLVGSGALAAINDMQETRARHRLTSTIANQAAGFDPTGLSGYALNYMDNERARIEDEKAQKVEEEVQKSLAEAEALQALSEDLERQRGSVSSRSPRRRATP
ncbi:hypothetical protein ILT44_08830 [Microvirga sp. BT689]|uniref:hypothetical protein n=1 Tax=Microvirga arvi TaxID=2778731 RepID=UPI00194EF424|nr:hypothetical protein [Microvirga arvi]MBM6580284.1 hypothetical protein [Microvirga arvi]